MACRTPPSPGHALARARQTRSVGLSRPLETHFAARAEYGRHLAPGLNGRPPGLVPAAEVRSARLLRRQAADGVGKPVRSLAFQAGVASHPRERTCPFCGLPTISLQRNITGYAGSCNKKGFRGSIAALLVLAAGGLAGCERSQQQTAGKAPPPPQVTVARPVARTIVDQDEYVGRFVAVDAVEVRARVSGYLDSIHFKDGQIIRKGDLLFTVDRRPFQNALDQARGSLAQARANLAYAESDLARADGLINGNVISKQTFDQRTQAKRVAEASVTAQEAAVRQAALDLEFTELRAPVTGRIGDRRVSPGNLVTGGTTGTTTLLATIQSTDPIRFEFTMDEGSYLRYVRAARNVADFASDGGNVLVNLKLIDERAFGHQGRMDFVDNAIDRYRAPSADAPCSPTRMARSRPACSGACRLPRVLPAKPCWFPTSPSAPSRCASSCSSSTIRMLPKPNT